MSIRKLLSPTNRRARLLVGLLLGALFCIQCVGTTDAVRNVDGVTVIDGKALGQHSPETLAKIKSWAEDDHLALLEYCLANYDKSYRDYTCTLVKQEKLAGKLGKAQEISVRFRESPYSVAMAWTKNAPIGDRILYIEGKWDNQMLVRPTNPFLRKLVGGSVLRDPDGEEAMKNTLRPVNMFGFRRSLENLIEVYQQAKKADDLKESFGGYAKVAGRDTVALVRHLPAEKDYPAHETRTYIDLEYLVPLRVEGTDWNDQLSCLYEYRDVKLNPGLKADDFTPQSNEMVPPK